MKNDIFNYVQSFFHIGSLLKTNQTFITLIPKNSCPKNVNHFRPISLCNVIYKVIPKILVNRFKPFMDYLITPFQNAFIKGRNIFDNILIAHEIFDMLGKMKGRKGCFGALKIDMSFKGCFGALKIDIYCSLSFFFFIVANPYNILLSTIRFL